MQDKQKEIIKCYRRLFPDETLKEVSHKTGIQATRVFRIFNGHEMRVSEYEIFERLIDRQVGFESEEFVRYARICHKILGQNRVKEMLYDMRMAVELSYQLKHADYSLNTMRGL